MKTNKMVALVLSTLCLSVLHIAASAAEAPAATLLATARPGVNIYTDSTAALTFEEAAETTGFSILLEGASVTTGHSEQTSSQAMRLNPPPAGEAYFTSSFGKNLNAPALLFARFRLSRMGVRFNGQPFNFGYNENTIGIGAYSDNNYTVCIDNTETFDPAKTYTGWTSVIWYDGGHGFIDDLAIIPFYRITYDLPGTGSDIVEYYLAEDTSKVSVREGVITGLAESYPVRDDIQALKVNATHIGWSTDPSAKEPMTVVPLKNENITLYPIFEKNAFRPGTNAYTGTAKAVTFDNEADKDLFTTAVGQTGASLSTAGISSLYGANNTALAIKSSDAANAGEAYYFKAAQKNISRPCVLLFDASLNYHVFYIDGTMYGSTGFTENEIVRINQTIGEYKGLTASAFTFAPGAAWYLDNYAVVPFYQIIYDMPEGEEDIVLYFLGEDEDGNTSLAVSADGTITGLPTEYPIDEWIVPAVEDKVFLGWTAVKGSAKPDEDGIVPLNGSDIVLYPVFEGDEEEPLITVDAPITATSTSFRTDSKPGLRFTASVNASVREIDGAEYGFLVSTEKLLGGETLSVECEAPFEKHVSFNGDGIDEVFGVVDDGETYRFSAVLYNLPNTKESYMTTLVIRSYVKVGDTYIYGNVHSDTMYDAAKRVPAEMVEQTPFLAQIISVCEN